MRALNRRPVAADRMAMLAHRLGPILLLVAVTAIAATAYVVSGLERSATGRAARETQLAQQMLTGMLDEETGLRGFALTRREEFLAPYTSGRASFRAAHAAARRLHPGGAAGAELLRQHEIADHWSQLAESQIALLRNDRALSLGIGEALKRKTVMDGFRAANRTYARTVSATSARRTARAGELSLGIVLGLCSVFVALGAALMARGTRHARAARDREQAYGSTQAEFGETLQVVQSEGEAHDLLKRHLERSVASTRVTVLNKNNSEDRIEATTAVADQTPMARALEAAGARSCVAVRLGRPVERAVGDDPLVPCAICGASETSSTCQPLLVGGKVIGSVLVEHDEPIEGDGSRRIAETVAQAAPVLSNLRTLAIAESRAATDALTGLPNRRSFNDTLKRMVAQSGRSLEAMAALALDLDHFKQINDGFGHEKGDEVLAAAAAALSTTVRSSDFVGRIGGEEFVVLAPATGADGAAVLAENLRTAISRVRVAGVERDITVSIGFAVYPDDAVDPDTLLRSADRALYAAKRRGRDRVENAAQLSEGAKV